MWNCVGHHVILVCTLKHLHTFLCPFCPFPPTHPHMIAQMLLISCHPFPNQVYCSTPMHKHHPFPCEIVYVIMPFVYLSTSIHILSYVPSFISSHPPSCNCSDIVNLWHPFLCVFTLPLVIQAWDWCHHWTPHPRFYDRIAARAYPSWGTRSRFAQNKWARIDRGWGSWCLHPSHPGLTTPHPHLLVAPKVARSSHVIAQRAFPPLLGLRERFLEFDSLWFHKRRRPPVKKEALRPRKELFSSSSLYTLPFIPIPASSSASRYWQSPRIVKYLGRSSQETTKQSAIHSWRPISSSIFLPRPQSTD